MALMLWLLEKLLMMKQQPLQNTSCSSDRSNLWQSNIHSNLRQVRKERYKSG
jgi:hypothetical protein